MLDSKTLCSLCYNDVAERLWLTSQNCHQDKSPPTIITAIYRTVLLQWCWRQLQYVNFLSPTSVTNIEPYLKYTYGMCTYLIPLLKLKFFYKSFVWFLCPISGYWNLTDVSFIIANGLQRIEKRWIKIFKPIDHLDFNSFYSVFEIKKLGNDRVMQYSYWIYSVDIVHIPNSRHNPFEWTRRLFLFSCKIKANHK